MKGAMFSTEVGVAVVSMLGLAASPRLPAEWGFAVDRDAAKKLGSLEQSGDWKIGRDPSVRRQIIYPVTAHAIAGHGR